MICLACQYDRPLDDFPYYEPGSTEYAPICSDCIKDLGHPFLTSRIAAWRKQQEFNRRLLAAEAGPPAWTLAFVITFAILVVLVVAGGLWAMLA